MVWIFTAFAVVWSAAPLPKYIVEIDALEEPIAKQFAIEFVFADLPIAIDAVEFACAPYPSAVVAEPDDVDCVPTERVKTAEALACPPTAQEPALEFASLPIETPFTSFPVQVLVEIPMQTEPIPACASYPMDTLPPLLLLTLDKEPITTD